MNIITIQGGALQTNCYMVFADEADGCVVIDPGFHPAPILEKAQLLGKKIQAVLLTHGHFDHVGGVQALRDATGCRVYLHEADLTLPHQLTLGKIPCTHHYGEGDTLFLAGLTFEILHTPGHTGGGVCILCADTIFCGDTLFAGSCGRTDFPGSDPTQMRRSLDRLSGLQQDYTLLPGHGEGTTLSQEKRYNPYLQVTRWN